MEYNEEKFDDFRKHLMKSNGDFSVFFGKDYVAFQYGDGKTFSVTLPPHKQKRGHRDRRMLALVTISQMFALIGSKGASSTVH